MDDESAFLAALAREPTDATARLVYADWLDERGDPRGEYLRLFCTVAGWHDPTAERAQVLERLQWLGPRLDRDWKAAVQRGSNWRTLFEANLLPPEAREYEVEYHFNPPATAEQLAAAEQALGAPLPADVRAMWSEFNGVQHTTRASRREYREPEPYLLDLESMPRDTAVWGQEYSWAETFDEVYGSGTFRKLLVIQNDAFAWLWVLCLDEVNGNPPGTVLYHDHDTPELAPLAASLFDLVCRRFTERFSHW